MKVIVIVIVLLIFLLINVYVFQRLWAAMPPYATLRGVAIGLMVLVLFSLVISLLFKDSLPIPVISFLYTVGSSWVLISVYFVLAFLFQDLLLLVNKVLNIAPVRVITHFSRENWTEMLFVIGFIALLIFGGYLRYLSKERVYLPIQFSKAIGKDSISDKSLRIVAVSDLHLGYTIGPNELDKWVTLINKEKPDMILIAGDLIDNSLRPLREKPYAEVLRKLNAPMGVYACMGNHEYIADGNAAEHETFFRDCNIKLLRDSYAEVDSMLYIVGRDDRSNPLRKDLSELVANLDHSKPIILLDHQPYDLHMAKDNGVDLQISGHTHQAQIWPLSLVTKWMYELDHGYKKEGDTHYYVSSGLGIWGGKFRIGTVSEYVVMDINSSLQ